jgi:hypothetical protein
VLDLVGTLLIGSTIGTLLAAMVSTPGISQASRLMVGGIAGIWVGLVVAVTLSGALNAPLTLPMLFSLPLLAVAALLATPAARAAIFRIPVRLVIGLNTFRVLGVLFLLLAAAGRLGGPFPYFAGIGDILTGLFALSVAGVAARSSIDNIRVIAWNAFGMLDLIVAVTLGVTSRNGSAIQLIHAGAGSDAITSLPWALVPLVGVPLYLVGHAIVFAHIRANATSRRTLGRRRPIDAMQAS